jgi:hypothetical protein
MPVVYEDQWMNNRFLYKVVNVEYKKDKIEYIKLIYVGDKVPVYKELTLIPYRSKKHRNRPYYVAIENESINDMQKYGDMPIYWGKNNEIFRY